MPSKIIEKQQKPKRERVALKQQAATISLVINFGFLLKLFLRHINRRSRKYKHILQSVCAILQCNKCGRPLPPMLHQLHLFVSLCLCFFVSLSRPLNKFKFLLTGSKIPTLQVPQDWISDPVFSTILKTHKSYAGFTLIWAAEPPLKLRELCLLGFGENPEHKELSTC